MDEYGYKGSVCVISRNEIRVLYFDSQFRWCFCLFSVDLCLKTTGLGCYSGAVCVTSQASHRAGTRPSGCVVNTATEPAPRGRACRICGEYLCSRVLLSGGREREENRRALDYPKQRVERHNVLACISLFSFQKTSLHETPWDNSWKTSK